MPSFYYRARNANEELVAGELQAMNLAQAVADLESQGLVIESIGTTPPVVAEQGASPFVDDGAVRGATVEQAALREHLSRVMERGREFLPALRAYVQELPAGRRRRELNAVLQVLERGDADRAATTFAALPGYWIPLLGAATASRDPERILREFVEESERATELRRQWWLSLAYPALLGGLALAVLVALSLFVIPLFRDIFNGFDLHLPTFTMAVLSIAEWISSGRILIVAAAIVVGGWLLRLATRLLPVSVRNWCGDHLGWRWGRATALARLSQFTADLLEAELATPQALRLAGIATGNPPIRRATARVAGGLDASGELAGGSHVTNILTATILHALSLERTDTSRIRLLREISACHAERARRRLSWTRGIIEPLAICAIGLVVGVTVVALFLPLVSLINALS